jgi:hypothetical protein
MSSRSRFDTKAARHSKPKKAKPRLLTGRQRAGKPSSYKVLGYTTDVTKCERCKKEEGLYGTYIVDGPDGVQHLGTNCAEQTVGRRVANKVRSKFVEEKIFLALVKAGGVSADVEAAVREHPRNPKMWPEKGVSPWMARYLNPKDLPLISSAQHKMDVTEAMFPDVMPRVMMFAPAKKSGFQVCAHASPACVFGCLNEAGKGAIEGTWEKPGPQLSQATKTRAFHRAPEAFVEKLKIEVANMQEQARKQGRTLQLRLNGTSDLPWENYVPKSWLSHMYDYTKDEHRWRQQPYYLTFSWNEEMPQSPLEMAREALAAGRPGVTVLMDDKIRKQFLAENKTYHGVPVIDGSTHDYRKSDPPGALIVLKPLGKKVKEDKRGFVIRSLDDLEKPGKYSGVRPLQIGRRQPAVTNLPVG